MEFKWFQIKIYNRILVTNSVPRDIGVVANNLCNFCSTERDTIYHYLWQCEQTRAFWTEFEKWLREKCSKCKRLNLTPALILDIMKTKTKKQKQKTEAGFDYILVVATYFVYKCRINRTRLVYKVFCKNLPTCIQLINMRTVF